MSGTTGPWLKLMNKNTGTNAGWAGPTGAYGDIVRVYVSSYTGTITWLNVSLDYNKY
jgi:hypothetical protein